MSSTATTRKRGEVLIRERVLGRVYALRFWAYGKRRYMTLGYESEGWDRDKAEEKLQNVMADVRRGLWVPSGSWPSRDGDVGRRDAVPLFGPFAIGLAASRRGQVAAKTSAHDSWALGHLLPFFADSPIDEIDAEALDGYRAHKVQESQVRARAIARGKPRRNVLGQILRPLSPGSVNRTIDHVQWVLSVAVEYPRLGLTTNAARGRRRRLPERPPAPVYIDSAVQIEALLEAAAELDRDPRRKLSERQAVVATFLFAGTRAQELCDLIWGDVDLAGARVLVGRSKTAAGLREIHLHPILLDILTDYRARARRGHPEDLVFQTLTGRPRGPDNLRVSVIAPVLRRADTRLARRGLVPLPRALTTHKLRHAFASILVALGEDPVSVMRQIGHTDPAFTLRVYAHLMSRDPADRECLRALVQGERVRGAVAGSKPIELSQYEAPIVHALAERGGRASRQEILGAVGEAMAGLHGAADLEALPSGPPRWQPRLGKARMRLARRGLLAIDTGGGEWTLTARGWTRSQR